MTEDQERPLRLEQLAEVENIDLMRAALQRFRRRTFLRGLVVILVVIALPATLRGLNEKEDSFAERLARADSHQIGRVLREKGFSVIVLEARRLQPGDVRPEYEGFPPPPPFVDGNRMLHLIVTATDIRNDETLAISPLSIGPQEPGGPDVRRGERAVEHWLSLGRGQQKIEFDVVVLTGIVGGSRGPGTHNAEECALPLNPLGVCELLKAEGRFLGHVSIDLHALGVPSRILE